MNYFEHLAAIVAAMPSGPQVWFSDEAAKVTPEALRAHLQRAWPTWPFGAKGSSNRGLRIVPGRPAHHWPLVRGQRGCGETMGTHAGYGIPILMYHVLGSSMSLKGIECIEEERNEDRAAVEPLHAALGGSPEGLDAYEANLTGGLLPGTEYSQERRDADNINLRLIDPSPEHLRFRDYLHERIRTGGQRVAVPDGLGVWENAAVCLGFIQEWPLYGVLTCPPAAVPLAWRVLHAAPQFDLGMLNTHKTHAMPSTGIANHLNVAHAFVAVGKYASEEQRAAWAGDPIFDIVLPAIVSQEAEWWLRYMEAAAAFDGLEQPELSWNALCAGCLWVSRKGGPWRPFFDAALALAQRRGWTDVVLALENQAARAQLD